MALMEAGTRDCDGIGARRGACGAAAFVPPHPVAALTKVVIGSRLSCVIVVRRRMLNPTNSSDAMAIRAAPAAATRGGYCVRAAPWVAHAAISRLTQITLLFD